MEIAKSPAETQHEELSCNYGKDATKLFQLLQAFDFDAVKARCQSHPSEARTWIIRYQKNSNEVRWRLLPLHSAVIFKAPPKVVKALLKTYPKAAQESDDQGMIPLHLAFRHLGESTLKELLDAYPQGVQVKDNRGRTPLDFGARRTGLFSSKFVRQYANAMISTSCKDNNDTMEVRSVMANESVAVANLKAEHEQEMDAIKEYYESRFEMMIRKTLSGLEKIKLDAKQGNRELQQQYAHDLTKMKQLVTSLEQQHETECNTLRGTIDKLQMQIQQPVSRSDYVEGREPLVDENNGWDGIRQDQERLHELIQAQKKEMMNSQQIRAIMISTLLEQDQEEVATQRLESDRIVELTKSIGNRIQRLTQKSPGAISPVPGQTLSGDVEDDISTLSGSDSLYM